MLVPHKVRIFHLTHTTPQATGLACQKEAHGGRPTAPVPSPVYLRLDRPPLAPAFHSSPACQTIAALPDLSTTLPKGSRLLYHCILDFCSITANSVSSPLTVVP